MMFNTFRDKKILGSGWRKNTKTLMYRGYDIYVTNLKNNAPSINEKYIVWENYNDGLNVLAFGRTKETALENTKRVILARDKAGAMHPSPY